MATKNIPILKLNNGDNDYYPLTVSTAVALDKPIIVKNSVGGYAAGDVITVTTTIYQILCKLFGTSNKSVKYDKVTIRTNKRGEMFVNRDALFKIDNDTIKESEDNTFSVDIESLIDNDVLIVKDNKISIDLSKLVDGDSLSVNKNGEVSINTEKFVRVDNDGIVKDCHGRICLNRKAIRLDDKYLYRDKHDRICFDASYLSNYDSDFIIMDNDIVTVNKKGVVTVYDTQTIYGSKTFNELIKADKGISIGSLNIAPDDYGLVSIKGLSNCDAPNSAITRSFLMQLLNNKDTYSNIPVFEALNMKSCYEVKCNADTIKAGTLDQFSGYKYSVDVPKGNIEVLKLRSSQDRDLMNVIISWGDGTITSVKDSVYIMKNEIGTKEGIYRDFSANDNEKNYYITHIYPQCDSRYVVSIYGNTYWGIHHSDKYPNLLYRVFESYLPIFNCVKSISDIANGSLRLIEVNLPAYYNFSEVQSFSSAFKNCLNLKRVNGFAKYIFNDSIRHSCSVFQGCSNMEYCDCPISGTSQNYKKSNNNFFDGCISLKSDLVDMIPSGGFSKKIVSMKEVFKDCKNLTCDDWDYVSSILWNDKNIIWTDTVNCFTGCNSDIAKFIPESWGGLKKVIFDNDLIIIKNMDEIYNLVQKIIDSAGLNLPLDNDSDLYNAIKVICESNGIKINLQNDTQLIKTVETMVVSLGAKQLITLF